MAGEWKYSESCNCWVCSICGSAALNDYAGRSTASNFCPTCGNPMIITMDTVEEVKEDG